MMKTNFSDRIGRPYFLSAVSLLVGLSLASGLSAGQQIEALEGINRVVEKHGAQHVQKIVEMKGSKGQSQPEEWELIVYDPTSEYLLREFWIGDTRATNEGINYDYYPKQQPPGFIALKRLKVDSASAFEVLVIEAKQAKIGFDSIDYHLRCREFSDEPIWTLTAKDADGYQVARVDLSGETGRVLRTVWSYREGRKVPMIKDSALEKLPAPLDLRDDERLRGLDVIGPATRKEPVVPAPIDLPDGVPIDPETEVPEVERIDPIDPIDPIVPDEP